MQMQANNDGGKQVKRVMIFVKYIYNYLIKTQPPYINTLLYCILLITKWTKKKKKKNYIKF